jgi:hypothetical protein
MRGIGQARHVHDDGAAGLVQLLKLETREHARVRRIGG